MPNKITASGIETKTQAEYVAELTADYESIYGSDINLSSSTPDGQMMMIYIQSTLDVLDLIVAIYNSFDPDEAIGNVLDQRCNYNGIKRQGGTYTITPVSITVDRALTLYGIDDEATQEVYTVADNAGTEWKLQNTVNIESIGTQVLSFRAAEPGAKLTIPNTITVPVSVVLGVSAINNPSTYTTLGLDEESDNNFKERRRKSVAIGSQGYYDSLKAALENITGVGAAYIYENRTGSTDGDGIPSHSIWVIVSGTGSDSEIADAIYKKLNAGPNMKGEESYSVTRPDGSTFLAQWDEVINQNLFIKFSVTSLDGISPIDYDGLIAYLVANFSPGVFEKVNTNELAGDVQDFDPNIFINNDGFSTEFDGSYTETLSPSTKQNQFIVSTGNIIVLPILPSPTVLSIGQEQSRVFTAKGGYRDYTWSLEVDNSGASIDSGTGEYTSGNSAGEDTIRVTDEDGNYTDIVITVT